MRVLRAKCACYSTFFIILGGISRSNDNLSSLFKHIFKTVVENVIKAVQIDVTGPKIQFLHDLST